MSFLSPHQVTAIVGVAIAERQVLAVRYQHTSDDIVVQHRLAPFDIGTTNPKNIRRFGENLYAYSYTRIDRKTNRPDPRVATFNINYFLEMNPTGEIFDEVDLCLRNLEVTNYDYRTCRFALLPNRDWFGNK
jgi:hypothetical protein